MGLGGIDPPHPNKKKKKCQRKKEKKWLCDIENWHVFSPSFTGVSSKKILQKGVVGILTMGSTAMIIVQKSRYSIPVSRTGIN